MGSVTATQELQQKRAIMEPHTLQSSTYGSTTLRTSTRYHCHVYINRLQSSQDKATETVSETSRRKPEFAYVCQNQQGYMNFTPGQKLGSITKYFSL